ncbi:unnamed protein product [Protopolystoma xenopodis]|uniref:Uncharacterized protein n=1 Tax=Protopolystoma xenopodis TaxID=117903 RepID=A0A3S5A7M6_9PLAT|nr:unnamed protein product [Protopolystoma xenopodis]
MTDKSLAHFHRNRRRLSRKQRQHESSSKANRHLVKRNPPPSFGGTDLRIFSPNTFTRNGSKFNNYETRDSSKPNFPSHTFPLLLMNRSLVMFLSVIEQLSWVQSSSFLSLAWITKSVQAVREIIAGSVFQSPVHQFSLKEDVHRLHGFRIPMFFPYEVSHFVALRSF